MFIRTLKQKRGEKVYRHVQLVESYRDPAKGNAPRTRILAHLGTVEGLGEAKIDQLILGLRRAKGEDVTATAPALGLVEDFGHVHAVGSVWDRLGLSEALAEASINGETAFSPAALIRMLVVNRICEPTSKLALLDWLDAVHYGGGEKPSYHHLLRAMDRLIDCKEKAEPAVARRLLSADAPLELVFYDITSTWFEGDRSLAEDDFRRYGYSRDRRFDRRQVVIGMVMTPDGIPLCHHVFPGDTADRTTVADVVRDLKERFSLRRVVFVGDRGMLSDENLEALLDLDLGFIVAHPLRHNRHAREVIGSLSQKIDRGGGAEQFLEQRRQGVRFVLAFSPQIAREVKAQRDARLRKADAWIEAQLQKLLFPGTRGRRPTPQGTYDRIRDHLRDHNLLGLYDVSLSDGDVCVTKDRSALLWESKIDGMLLVETTDMESPPEEVIRRYKELSEIERGWRCLKSTLLLRPVFHWTERRIRAHIFMCVLALQLERWMRRTLKDVCSVPKAIRSLQRIKVGEIKVAGTRTRAVSRPLPEQKVLLETLGVAPLPVTI